LEGIAPQLQVKSTCVGNPNAKIAVIPDLKFFLSRQGLAGTFFYTFENPFNCSGRRTYQYNEDDIHFPFFISTNISNTETYKHVNKEKLSINIFSLFTCKRCVRNLTIIRKKSSSLYWNKCQLMYSFFLPDPHSNSNRQNKAWKLISFKNLFFC